MRLKLSGADISPAMSELVLFAMNQRQMHQEIVDLCTGRDKDSTSDIHKYYLAESILQGKTQKGSSDFAKALKATKLFGEKKELSPCEITQ